MVTMNEYGGVSNKPTAILFGMSADAKPTITFEGVALTNGSFFIEIDTNDIYEYDEEHHTWKKK